MTGTWAGLGGAFRSHHPDGGSRGSAVALLDQLACGGRRVAPVGRAMQPQDLVVIGKTAGCVIRARTVTTVRFVPMVHERDDKP